MATATKKPVHRTRTRKASPPAVGFRRKNNGASPVGHGKTKKPASPTPSVKKLPAIALGRLSQSRGGSHEMPRPGRPAVPSTVSAVRPLPAVKTGAPRGVAMPFSGAPAGSANRKGNAVPIRPTGLMGRAVPPSRNRTAGAPASKSR